MAGQFYGYCHRLTSRIQHPPLLTVASIAGVSHMKVGAAYVP